MSLSRSLFLLLLVLLTLALVGCVPEPRGGRDDDDTGDDDDTSDDDDDTGSGDDDTGSGDDDTAAGDDDSTPDVENTEPPTDCPTGLDVISEIEPNNTPDDGELHDIGTVGGGGFCIQGNLDCGNDGKAFIEGVDFFFFMVAEGTTGDFGLDWTTSSDLDFLLQDDADVLHDFEEGISSSESASAIPLVAGTQYIIRVACWEGADGSYAMWASW
jgi:hypothetical protein